MGIYEPPLITASTVFMAKTANGIVVDSGSITINGLKNLMADKYSMLSQQYQIVKVKDA